MMRAFYNVLLNTLIANITSSFLWFALSFWVYLETKSVLATAIIGGSFMLLIAVSSLFFGTLVDKHHKKQVMLTASAITLASYIIAGIIFLSFPTSSLADLSSPGFWLFAVSILIGSVVENMRNIALSTVVTILVPKQKRANANGLVGSVQGLGFLVTSVFSGLAIGFLGIGWTLAIAITLTAIAFVHLLTVAIPEKRIAHDPELANKKIDIRGSILAIKAVPGLVGLILFTTLNNFVGGAYMALLDPYGLSLFSVQLWGVVLGVTSTGFIIGGLIVAKRGLGKSPIRTLLLVNIAIALIGMFFGIREWWVLFVVGVFLYMCLVPVAEATEQTIIQRVVPLERQGRVFGFAQSIEAGAAPISTFAIGPLAQFVLIPYANSEQGSSSLSWLLGTGNARGIALVFLITGLIILIITILAFFSRSYKLLSAFYARS